MKFNSLIQNIPSKRVSAIICLYQDNNLDHLTKVFIPFVSLFLKTFKNVFKNFLKTFNFRDIYDSVRNETRVRPINISFCELKSFESSKIKSFLKRSVQNFGPHIILTVEKKKMENRNSEKLYLCFSLFVCVSVCV